MILKNICVDRNVQRTRFTINIRLDCRKGAYFTSYGLLIFGVYVKYFFTFGNHPFLENTVVFPIRDPPHRVVRKISYKMMYLRRTCRNLGCLVLNI